MYELGLSASIMALILLGLLYVLFHMGLRENMSPVDTGKENHNVRKLKSDCSVTGRVKLMIMAWNDTMNSPRKINVDINVYFKLWSSNVIRRGLDPIYTHSDLFTAMYRASVQGALTEEVVAELMTPYYQQELQNAEKNQPTVMPLQPFCMNP